MIRRLAKQSRKDAVLSKKDYQEILPFNVAEILFKKGGASIVFRHELSAMESELGLVGVGAFLSAKTTTSLKIEISYNGTNSLELQQSLGKDWARFGRCISVGQDAKYIELKLTCNEPNRTVFVWGLSIGVLALPEKILESNPTEEVLNQIHLMPETLYLPHRTAIDGKVTVANQTDCSVNEKSEQIIHLKKCAYCQRLLPLEPTKPGVLSFHKHNAKISGHQNECRACKKWRINDSFNPLRTVDQLHESSVITRERSLFLREPEILQRIKDREGAGLKGIIWEKFGRKCFRCKRPLELKEVHLDHTRPMAYLYPIDEYATCLCPICNNFKTDKFPIDAYDSEQLKELSEITGLPLSELIKKDVNEKELNRMIAGIEIYAKSWDPKSFAATARKIREYRPDVDLFAILKAKDEAIYNKLMDALARRPKEED